MLDVQYSTSILNALLFIAAFYLLTACIKRNPGSILSSSSSLLGPWMQSGKKSCSLRQLRSIQITSSISFHYLHIHLRSYDPTILHSIALLHSLNSSFKLGNQFSEKGMQKYCNYFPLGGLLVYSEGKGRCVACHLASKNVILHDNIFNFLNTF